MAVGDAFKAAATKVGLDAARDSAQQLAKALQDAKAAADALKPPPTPSQAAANEVRRLASEARAAEAAYNALAKAQARAEAAGSKAAFKALKNFSSGAKGPVSPWASGKPPPGGPVSPKMPGMPAGAKAAEDAGGDPEKAGASAFKAPKDLKYILKHAGIGKAAMGAMGAAAGLELTKLALGYRGMAMLQAVTQRAGLQIRQLFAGVDPKPVVRAFDTLTNQIFNKAGPAGKALASIFDHVFNGLFGGVEKAEPVLQGFFEYAIVGALKLETAYYELRLAALPLQDSLSGLADAVSPLASYIDDLTSSTGAMGGAFGGANQSIQSTVDELKMLIDLVDKAAKGWKGLAEAFQGKGAWQVNAKERLGMISKGEAGKERAERGVETQADILARKYGGGAAPTEAPGSAAASEAAGFVTGKAYPSGLAKGIDAGAPAAAAAGGAAADGVNKSAQKALGIQSPSKVGAETGEEYPAGLAVGVRRGAPEAQEEMAKAAMPKGGAAGTSATSTGPSNFSRIEALLVQIEANTRPRSGAQRSGGWGEPVHTIASVLGVSAS